MPKKEKQSSGGNRKHGRNKDKCAAYKAARGIPAHKKRFYFSKGKRGCGPLGYAYVNGQPVPGFTTRAAALRKGS
jgi:hypothetical protein